MLSLSLGELSAASSRGLVIDRIRGFLGFARQALGLKPRGVASHHVRRTCTTTLDPSTCERYFAKRAPLKRATACANAATRSCGAKIERAKRPRAAAEAFQVVPYMPHLHSPVRAGVALARSAAAARTTALRAIFTAATGKVPHLVNLVCDETWYG